jgi:hypothetical protein
LYIAIPFADSRIALSLSAKREETIIRRCATSGRGPPAVIAIVPGVMAKEIVIADDATARQRQHHQQSAFHRAYSRSRIARGVASRMQEERAAALDVSRDLILE